MNVYFSSAHLQTLCELKALAEKHNCFITFGVDNYHDFIGYEKFDNYSENVIKEFNDHGYFCNDSERGNVTFFWFQLYDPNNLDCRYHGLKYITGWQQVGYVLNDDNSLSEHTPETLSLSSEFFITIMVGITIISSPAARSGTSSTLTFKNLALSLLDSAKS